MLVPNCQATRSPHALGGATRCATHLALLRSGATLKLALQAGARPDASERPATTVLFSTNDYLGLASHPEVKAAASAAAAAHGSGPRASAIVAGHTHLHERLERQLAALKGAEAALLFPTGAAPLAAGVPFAACLCSESWRLRSGHVSVKIACLMQHASADCMPGAMVGVRACCAWRRRACEGSEGLAMCRSPVCRSNLHGKSACMHLQPTSEAEEPVNYFTHSITTDSPPHAAQPCRALLLCMVPACEP